MSTDEFTKMFNYMTERFDRIDKTLEAKANSDDLQTAINLFDTLAKHQEISEVERIIS